MDTTFLSVGLIHRTEKNQTQYLLVNTGNSDRWSPVVGIRLEKESFRDTIIREISWVLQLDRKKDFLVSNMSASSQEYVEEGVDGIHHFAVAFYRARLYSQAARDQIDQDARVRWITTQELCQGTVGGEKLIESRIVDWINQWSVLNPWE